ncbi:molecular chaperone DnaJ [Halobaculum sp. MBLA0147]|uniref:molecular chaperone DnaJ n=1 Tax=Halobaculum sp. MBLA0147 TaxID=3079934 RepID=UPI003525F619
MSEDFYDILGVSRDASEEEIEQAYRQKATEYHPDVSDEPDAEEKFKKIKKAKEVLTDEEKRQAYDRMGHDQFEQAEKRGGFEDGRGGGAGGPFGGAGGAGGPFGGAGGGGGMGGIGDIFEEFFGGGGGRGSRAGKDLRTRMEITLQEAYEGTTKEFTAARPERCGECGGRGYPRGTDVRTCPQCNGRGQVRQVQQTPLGRVQQTTTCPDCEGEGEIPEESCAVCDGSGITREEATLTVDVPAGIEDGQTLRMDGEGAPGERGAPDGDLLIDVEIADSDRYERDGADLHVTEPISFPQAVFGDTVRVDTLGGTVELDVPAGTQSGETFRLRGKGMPKLRGRRDGDLFVQVRVVTPENLNDEQKEALQAFAEAGGEEVDVSEGFFEKLNDFF